MPVIFGFIQLLFGAAPQILKLVEQHQAAANDQDRQIIAQRIEALKGAYDLAKTQAGQIIVLAFAVLIWVYLAKIIIWDKVLGHYTHGTTDPIEGHVAVWVGMILTFIFGHGIYTLKR